MIHTTLHEDLKLSKKSARWVPTEEMKNKRVRTCKTFLVMVRCHSIVMLDQIFTMDDSAVAFHTPQTKHHS
jgi:hypothetical protein